MKKIVGSKQKRVTRMKWFRVRFKKLRCITDNKRIKRNPLSSTNYIISFGFQQNPNNGQGLLKIQLNILNLLVKTGSRVSTKTHITFTFLKTRRVLQV